ncbi:MAG TPA: tetratricopeptide repeat protein [Miltoncostaeaceae bacterium]|nr:tetratricopeptide repeat protein [Miltoncostaeaceae bacterium]
MSCARPGCTGTIVDGYCDLCGMAPRREDAQAPVSGGSPPPPASIPASTRPARSTTATSRRETTRRSGASGPRRIGAGLVEVPPIPYRDPAEVVLADPGVAENRRFCGRCGEPVGRSREGSPGRAEGFCRSCGAPFSFAPKLVPGDLVAGQYEVAGCLAHGGMGWIYLARDRNVSDRWVVLKGLLNSADQDAMAAALAERRFLAEVEHPNIVRIYNFVQHEQSGYIVMEYVGGSSLRGILTHRREANGGRPDPLPVAQAIAYILEVLPGLAYLHSNGLLFCDFKLDNVIQTGATLKLIDLGGVYRIGDMSSPVYGTVGYQAPEIADSGPSVASDLFTVARTLAIMSLDFRGYQTTYRYTVPPQESSAVLTEFDALHRFLARGMAADPDERFHSAEEMAEQLLGVLRQVVAARDGVPVPGASTLFTGDFRADPLAPDWRRLPALRVEAEDAAAGSLALFAAEPEEVVASLRAAPERTAEMGLRLAKELIDVGDVAGAEEALAEVEALDDLDWRVAWYRGVAGLSAGRPADARAAFAAVYHAVPGELAARLALGVAAEYAGDVATAADLYAVVSGTDPSFTTATFGLGRCRRALDDVPGALAAYASVPESSISYTDGQVMRIECLVDGGARAAGVAELSSAAAILEPLGVDRRERARITGEILAAALALVERDGTLEPEARVLGRSLSERDLREGLERNYRELARLAPTRDERIRMVDDANRVRPRTWT